MTSTEKDRLIEVLFYLFFNNTDAKTLGKAEYWEMIHSICKAHNIEAHTVSKAVRLLIAKENIPSEEEIYYLLNEAGLTVRPINKISGIYWQKQIKYGDQFKLGMIPKIDRKITDIVVKKSMRDFIMAMYSTFGIFNNIELKTIQKIL